MRHRSTRGGGRICRAFWLARLMQRFFEQAPRFKMRLAPSRHVNDFTSAGIAGSRLGTRIFNLKDPEAANFNAIAFNQAVAHCIEETVYHLSRQVFFTIGVVAN